MFIYYLGFSVPEKARAGKKMLKYRSEDIEEGVVTFFDNRPDKRFGFILDASSGKTMFFHFDSGGNHGSRNRNRVPMKDDRVYFIRIDGDKGPKARLWAFDRFDMVYHMGFKGWLAEGERLPPPDGEALRAFASIGKL